MNVRSSRSWRRSARGTTLVEAVLGTALLASLLGSILLAASRLSVQATQADRRIAACRLADRLLEGWWEKPDMFPRRGEGRLEDGWTWRIRAVPNDGASALRGEVVALEILAPDPRDGAAAARVELLVPEEEDEPQTGADAR